MRKNCFIFAILLVALSFNMSVANAANNEEMVTIKIPADEVKSIDVKYQQPQESKSTKFVDSAKSAAKKTADSTKKLTHKTVNATKNVTKKTVESTKELTDKTIGETKGFLDNMNPNKVVTVEELETKASIKTLKNERKELKAAYNSRIKDIDAKIKLTAISSDLSEAQRQNRIKKKKKLLFPEILQCKNITKKLKN